MKEKTRVAVLGYYPIEETTKNLGGVHIPVFDLTEQLRRYGDLDVHVITNSDQIREDMTVKKDNLIIHHLSSPKLSRLVTCLSIDQYKVIKKVKKLDPDIIHAHCTAPLYGFPASLLSKKYPAVLTVHGVTQEEAKTWRGIAGYIKRIVYVQMDKHVLKTIRNVIVDTPYVTEKIRSFCKGKIYVIPIGINKDCFYIENNVKEDRLLFVGGIEPRKGLLNLLRTVKIVKKTNPKIRLHVVGRARKQNYFNELKEYADSNDLTENVIFSGFLDKDELKREYGECSVFVFPSREESQGVVLVEAMTAGKPIVALNIGGIPYVVDDNETGFLAEYENVEKLAEEITQLLNDKDLRERIGGRGKEKAKEFLNVNIAAKLITCIKRCLNRLLMSKSDRKRVAYNICECREYHIH